MNEINQAAAEIMQILADLSSPRHAAAAIAAARANLFILGGAESAADVSKMMNEDDKAAMELWETITRGALSS
jgi:acetyl-CoA acetyltransferase